MATDKQNENRTGIRQERAQMYAGDIEWITPSREVTPEQTAAVLQDQEDRRKAFRRKQVADAVKSRLPEAGA